MIDQSFFHSLKNCIQCLNKETRWVLLAPVVELAPSKLSDGWVAGSTLGESHDVGSSPTARPTVGSDYVWYTKFDLMFED